MMTRGQEQILINKFNNLSTNQQAPMEAPFMNYVLIPSEGKINPGYPQGLKIYSQSTKEIDKESNKLDISVSNAKYIILFSQSSWKIWLGTPCIHGIYRCRCK